MSSVSGTHQITPLKVEVIRVQEGSLKNHAPKSNSLNGPNCPRRSAATATGLRAQLRDQEFVVSDFGSESNPSWKARASKFSSHRPPKWFLFGITVYRVLNINP